MKHSFGLGLAILTLIGATLHCSAANLTFADTAELESGHGVLGKHRDNLGLNKLPANKRLQIKGVDRWNSWIVRMFTPAEDAVQSFEAVMDLSHPFIRMALHYQDSDSAVYTLDGDSFEGGSSLDRLYVGPMRDYLTWNLRLPLHENLQYHGKRTLDEREYLAFFHASGDLDNPAADHYRIYLDARNLEVRLIHFTLRELAESYSGWIHYSDYRSVDGVRIPHFIAIQDGPSVESADGQNYVHRIEVQSAYWL
ncbi:MAG: hypothetical protein KDK23_11025 [Leptospiraceae bacterium]|nr:hypothetical protein [Leptospiraceae bacterium]